MSLIGVGPLVVENTPSTPGRRYFVSALVPVSHDGQSYILKIVIRFVVSVHDNKESQPLLSRWQLLVPIPKDNVRNCILVRVLLPIQ